MLRRLLWMYGKHYISKQVSNIPPEEVTPVNYAHHVACELEAGNGDIDLSGAFLVRPTWSRPGGIDRQGHLA